MAMEDRAVTYGMLDAAITRCAHRITALDIPPGGLVAVEVQNRIRHLTLCLALFRSGVASVSLAPGQAAEAGLTLAVRLGDTPADGSAHAGRSVAVTDAWFSDDIAAGALPPGFSDGSQICRISLTSGSTGQPKAVTYTVRELARRMQRFVGFVDMSHTGVLCLPGLSSNFGFTAAAATLFAGRKACFSQSPYQAASLIELFSLDVAIAAPEQLLALTRVARKLHAQPASLRTITIAGDRPTHVLLEAAAQHLCRDIRCLYGASETGPIALANACDVVRHPGLAGHVLPGNEVAVFTARDTRCAAGELGAVAVRANDDAGAARRWIDVGDIGWIADDGQLHVLGRASELEPVKLVRAPTQDISPGHEVEHALRLEWDVTDAAAVLVEPAGATPQIWIGVVDNGGASADQLAALARARGIAHDIRIVDLAAIPRSVNGKIRRIELKAAMLAASPSPSAPAASRTESAGSPA